MAVMVEQSNSAIPSFPRAVALTATRTQHQSAFGHA